MSEKIKQSVKPISKQKSVRVNVSTGEIEDRKIIKTNLTATAYESHWVGEKNDGKSRTVPDQSITVREMLKRHTQGLTNTGVSGVPIYNGDELIPDLSKMDLPTRQEYLDYVADQLVEVKNRLEEAAKNKKEAEYIKKVNDAVQEELKKMRDQAPASTTQNDKKAGS